MSARDCEKVGPFRSSSITAELESSGTSGVIVAQGGAHSGWSLFVKDGKPAFAYNFLGKVTTIKAKTYDKSFFAWVNFTHMHLITHTRKESMDQIR